MASSARLSMRRRHLLGALDGATVARTGCTGDDGSETSPSVSTRTDAGTPMQAEDLRTIEYTVTNEDDETHRLTVTLENVAGPSSRR